MKHLLIILLAAITSSATAQDITTEEALEWLDREMCNKQLYDLNKQSRIDSMRARLSTLRNDPRALCIENCRIGREYETFISDSAMAYYDRGAAIARTLNDTMLIKKVKLDKIKVLSIMGFFHEAINELDSLERQGIPAQLQEQWLNCGRQLYSYIEAYTLQGKSDNMDRYLEVYVAKQRDYRMRQLELLPRNSNLYKLYTAEQYYIDGKGLLAKRVLNQILDSLQPDNNIYARAAANMAIIRQSEDNSKDAARYLALSAIADIKSSVKETTSLQKLAMNLYEAGDINRAYRYISASLADAVYCNARLRTTEISNFMPLIDEAYKIQLSKKHRLLTFTTSVSTLLAIAFVGACFFLLKQMRKLSDTKQQLRQANSIKDEYIGHFLDLCSIYMDRLDNFCKTVTRKITAGQTDDLVKMTKSSKFAEEQHKLFYENFDKAFLHIYPSFIDDLNSLLRPEERIIVKDPGTLTTELRIFALLRMGVDDANKIAGFLHYSINTIYAYRNKTKNKAVDREHFEENVMKIGSIQ